MANNSNFDWLRGEEGFTTSPHSTMEYQLGSPSLFTTMETLGYPNPEGLLTISSSSGNVIQQPLSSTQKLVVAEYGTDIKDGKSRKRSIEFSNIGEYNNLVGNKEATLGQWIANKINAATLQKQWHKEELREIQRKKVRVSRSQKLSDRITALQKLVSPYGKTDTASVLQEASISIKLLQNQIQRLFQMLSVPATNTRPLHLQKPEEKHLDLRSRGLCLVPVSVTLQMAKVAQLS